MMLSRSIPELLLRSLIPAGVGALLVTIMSFPSANANQLDPATMCRTGTDRFSMDVIVCSAAINSGKHSEHSLSALHVARSKALRLQNQCQRALSDATTAIQITPWLATAFNEKGLIQRCLGDHPASLKSYAKALELSPNDQEAWRNQGIAQYFENELDKSIESLGRSVELNPVNPEAYAFRGFAFHALGESENAGRSMLACDELRFAWSLLPVWRALTIASADGNPVPYINQQLAQLGKDEWPRPLLELFADRRTLADLENLHSAPPEPAGVVDFYLAEKARIDRNKPEARRLLLKAIREIQDLSRVELILAKRLLNRLNQ